MEGLHNQEKKCEIGRIAEKEEGRGRRKVEKGGGRERTI